MEGLGRIFNVIPTADAVEVNLRDYSGVTFICVGADTYTIREAQDAAGTGIQDLLAWRRWYTNSGAVGATAWVEQNDDTPAAAQAIAANAAVYVDSSWLSDGFDYVTCISTASGLVTAILHEPKIQRAPSLLVAPAL